MFSNGRNTLFSLLFYDLAMKGEKMKLALVDERMPKEAKNRLSALGYYVISMPADKRLSAPVASHPDMLVFYHNGTLIASADYCEAHPFVFEDISRFTDCKMIFTEDEIKASYPHDACFNASVVGNRIFYKEDSISENIKEYARSVGLAAYKTKQGYPACTSLALSDTRVITADRGFGDTMRGAGLEVTLIENGDISLPPYEYGFIGGASGKDGKRLFFIGDISRHQSKEKIISSAKDNGLEIISLYRGELLDLGRIIFIE